MIACGTRLGLSGWLNALREVPRPSMDSSATRSGEGVVVVGNEVTFQCYSSIPPLRNA